MISFDPTDDEKAIRDEVRKFAEGELRAQGRDCEKSGEVPEKLRRTYHELGLATLDWPEAAGGAGLSAVARAIVEEELARGDAGLALALDGPGLASRAILELGSDEDRARWLPRLAARGAVAALAIAESDLGSDLGRVATAAVPDGAGGYILNGRKLFVLNAPPADLFVVVAKGDPAPDLFVLERDTPGLALGRQDDRLGLQACRSCEVKLDDARAPAAARIAGSAAAERSGAAVGTAERSGALDRWDRFLARSWVTLAARAVGIARAATEYATFYAQDRSAFGRKIGSFQGVAFKIEDMATSTDAARWLVWRAAAALARGAPDAMRQAALAAVHANETAVGAAIDCVQILGGAGFMEDYPAEKWMREARALAAILGNDPVRNHLAAEREYGPDAAAGGPDPAAAFAALGQAFGG